MGVWIIRPESTVPNSPARMWFAAKERVRDAKCGSGAIVVGDVRVSVSKALYRAYWVSRQRQPRAQQKAQHFAAAQCVAHPRKTQGGSSWIRARRCFRTVPRIRHRTVSGTDAASARAPGAPTLGNMVRQTQRWLCPVQFSTVAFAACSQWLWCPRVCMR